MTDREIDRQVAIKIMGLKPLPDHKGRDIEWWRINKYTSENQPPPYTTDPSAFMQVVERMREKGHRVQLSTWRSDGSKWYATFAHNNPTKWGRLEYGIQSLGRAICLAALEAVK